MKKFLSILLVVMLVLSMIPATVSAATGTAKITFDSTSKRTEFSTSKQVWVENGITVTNNKAGSSSNVANYSNPARFYKSSELIIEYPGMTQIEFTCSSASYATALKNSISGSTASGSVVTVKLAGEDSVKYTMTGGQVRVSSLTVTYTVAEECDHVGYTPVSNEDAKDPTCTEAGNYASTKCPNCNATIDEQVEIPALGHEYENDACVRCGMVDPACPKATLLTEEPGVGDVIVIYNPAEKLALGNEVSYDDLAGVLAESVENQLPYNTAVAQLTVGLDGTYYTFTDAAGAYLSSDSDGGSLSFTEEASAYSNWTLESAGENLWYISNAAASQPALEIYKGDFTTYTAGTSNIYKMELYLVSKAACTHASKTEQSDGYAATCTEDGLTNSWKCDACGNTVVPQEIITAPGHSWVDGVCKECGAEQPKVTSATYVFSEYAAGVQYATNEEHVLDENVTMYTTESHFTTELRLYSSATHNGFAIIESALPIDSIGFNAGNKVDTLKIYGSNDEGTTWELIEDISITTTSYKDYSSKKFNDTYYWIKLDVAGANQVRVKTLTLNFVQPVVETKPFEDAKGNAYDTVEEALKEGVYTLKPAEGVTAPEKVSVTVDGKTTQYVALAMNEGFYTYYFLGLKSVSIRSSEAGMYFQAQVKCDEELASQVDSYGVVMSLKSLATEGLTEEEYAYTKTETETGIDTTEAIISAGVFNIFKEGRANNAARGEIAVYAKVYLVVDGRVIAAEQEVEMSFKQALTMLNSRLDPESENKITLNTYQTDELKKFVQLYGDVLDTWGLTHITGI